jgi:hypothetical protein
MFLNDLLLEFLKSANSFCNLLVAAIVEVYF